ncbi:MAG TPA: hypothetical protein ENK32_10115 [Anaerolineae bacterium]|nr:hypothetical protein [Anaerolineae bacterium]
MYPQITQISADFFVAAFLAHCAEISRVTADFTEKNRKGREDRKGLPEKNPDQSAQSAAFFSRLTD